MIKKINKELEKGNLHKYHELKEQFFNDNNNTFTIRELVTIWQEVYGEDLLLDYSGFIQKLVENGSN